ncbi:MAG: alpha-L-fucosidase [Tangfeifania sp.]
MKLNNLLLMAVLLAVFACGPQQKKSSDTNGKETAEAPDDKMEWWRDARFGMFIHWGLYAIPAGEYNGNKTEGIGEWIMNNEQIPIKEYEKYAAQFNPEKFDAEEWVSILKDAGMKYIVITSKHHDGFCLWDSKVTEYDVMDASPFKRDILAELAEACKKEGIRFGLYHSIMDWHHPQAQAIWEPNYNKGGNDTVANPEFPQYFQNYLKPQVAELMDNYPTEILWFDGEWIPAYTTEMGKELYQFIMEKDPQMIVNNRVDKGRQGMSGFNAEGDFAGDFGTPEQEIPDTGVEGVDWESCMTMNDTWGYKYFDDNWKSEETLIRNLIDIASKGGNFLLNVGPKADGAFPQASIDRLKAMGDWMDKYSESIYGTTSSPFARPDWGRYTQKDNRVYAHVFDWPEDKKLVVDASAKIAKAWLLDDGSKNPLEVGMNGGNVTVSVPENAPDEVASVIVLEIED